MSTLKVDTYLTRGGASEIAIDKLKGVTAAGSMLVVGEGGTVTTNLQQGLGKAWACWQGNEFTTIKDSFNASGGTDNGAGDFTLTIINDMSNVDYSQICTHGEGTSTAMSTSNANTGRTKATGSCHFMSSFMAGSGGGNNTLFDALRMNVVLMGDLA